MTTTATFWTPLTGHALLMGAVRRINQRLISGESRDAALRREDIRNTRQRLALVGATYAAMILAQHGGEFITNRADVNRAAAKVAPTINIGANAAKIKYVTPNRSGVHKITTMK